MIVDSMSITMTGGLSAATLRTCKQNFLIALTDGTAMQEHAIILSDQPAAPSAPFRSVAEPLHCSLDEIPDGCLGLLADFLTIDGEFRVCGLASSDLKGTSLPAPPGG